VNLCLDLLAQKYLTQAAVLLVKECVATGTIQKASAPISINSLQAAGMREAQMHIDAIVDAGGDKLIWGRMKAKDPLIEGTMIPKSFLVSFGGKELWVSGNVTEHLAEKLLGKRSSTMLTSPATTLINPANKTRLANELVLSDLFKDLQQLVKQLEPVIEKGATHGVPFKIGEWTIVLQKPKRPGFCTEVIHVERSTWKK
jgi:hypothetical protein